MQPEDVKKAHEFAYNLGERHEAHLFGILNKDGTMSISYSGDRGQKAIMALTLPKLLSEMVAESSHLATSFTTSPPGASPTPMPPGAVT